MINDELIVCVTCYTSLVKNVTFRINENMIQTFDGYQLMMLNEMRGITSLKNSFLMHLPFFFCHHTRALPMVSLFYNHVNIVVETNDNVLPDILTPELLLSYAMLDHDERSNTARIEKNLDYTDYFEPCVYERGDNGSTIVCKPTFKHEVKALFFTLHDEDLFTPLENGYVNHNFSIDGLDRHHGDQNLCILDKLDSNINTNCGVYVIPFSLGNKYQCVLLRIFTNG